MNDEFGIPSELVQKLLRTQWELREQFRDSLRIGVRLGHLLETVRQQCRHGEWERWLKSHYEGTPRHTRRLVELAKEYPNPNDVPSMTLREALRLIAGKSATEKKFFAHERLSRSTIDRCLGGLTIVDRALKSKILAPLEVEGLTGQHEAVKQAKAIGTAIRRLREFLECQVPEDTKAPGLAVATEGTA